MSKYFKVSAVVLLIGTATMALGSNSAHAYLRSPGFDKSVDFFTKLYEHLGGNGAERENYVEK